MARIIKSTGSNPVNIEAGNSVIDFTSGTLNSIAQINIDNIRIDGNLISAEDAGGNITLKPNTTGSVDIFEPPASEAAGININGVTYDTALRVNDIGGTSPAQFIAHRHSTTLAPIILGARTNNDTTSHSDVTLGQSLLTTYGAGWSTSSYKLAAAIDLSVDSTGTVSAASMPGRIRFQVTPDGSLTPATAMTITNDKNIKLEANSEFSATYGITGSTGSRLIFTGSGSTTAHMSLAGATFSTAGTNTNISFLIKPKGSSAVQIASQDSSQSGKLTMFEASANGTNSSSIEAPASITSTYRHLLPAQQPASSLGNVILQESGTSSVVNTWSGDSTNALLLPSGTTAQQPANNAGLIRYNSDNTTFEGNDGSNWLDVPFETIGTWTPTPYGTTTAGSPTGTFEGRFILNGTTCKIWGRLIFTSLSTMAGNFGIGSLPYTVRNSTINRGAVSVGYRHNFTNDFTLTGFNSNNSTNILMYRADIDNTSVGISDLSATTNIYFYTSYEIA